MKTINISLSYSLLPCMTLILCNNLHAQTEPLNDTTELPFKNHPATYSQIEPAPLVKSSDPLGLEAVTGFRTSYIHRGQLVSHDFFDFQIYGLFSYSKESYIEYGTWFGTGTGDESVSETGLSIRYSEVYGRHTHSVKASYLNRSETHLGDRLEFDYIYNYQFNKDHSLEGLLSYELENDTYYASLSHQSYYDIDDKSFISTRLGVAFSDNHLPTNGFNNLFGRLSYTYNIDANISASLFTGFSVTRDNDTYYAGAWFETSF